MERKYGKMRKATRMMRWRGRDDDYIMDDKAANPLLKEARQINDSVSIAETDWRIHQKTKGMAVQLTNS